MHLCQQNFWSCFFILSVSCKTQPHLGLHKDPRCARRPAFLRDAPTQRINQRDGWLIRHVDAKVHMCDPGQGDCTRLHLKSLLSLFHTHTHTHTHTQITVVELTASIAPHPFCWSTSAAASSHFPVRVSVCVCVCVCVCAFVCGHAPIHGVMVLGLGARGELGVKDAKKKKKLQGRGSAH